VSERTLGLLLVLASAVLWSGGGLGIKLVDAHPAAIAGLRSALALPVIATVLWARLRGSGRGGGRGPSADGGANSPLRDCVRRPLVWAAALAYAVAVMLFVGATRLTTAANAILLQYTSPIYVALLAPWVLRERTRLPDWLAVGGCLIGMACFFAAPPAGTEAASVARAAAGPAAPPAPLLGDVLAVVSGMGFGTLTVLLRRARLDDAARVHSAPRARSPLDGLVAVGLGNALAAVLAAPWYATGAPTDVPSWLVLTLLGTLQIGVAYALFVAATARVGAVDAGLVSMLEPVLNPIWVLIGYGERPSLGAVLGGFFIVGSVTARTVLHARAHRSAVARAVAAGARTPGRRESVSQEILPEERHERHRP
jgi:drug/metabolite transporter (DMT)-like permease